TCSQLFALIDHALRRNVLKLRRFQLHENDMQRRTLFKLLGGAAVCPISAWAQPEKTRVIGYLQSGSWESMVTSPLSIAAFRQGLSETGYVEGQNLAIEYRGAEGHYDRLPALAELNNPPTRARARERLIIVEFRGFSARSA